MQQETSFIKDVIYIAIWFAGAAVSIIYGLIGGKKYSIISSFWMVAIWAFVWWVAWTLTANTAVAAIAWALSLEIMHTIKEYGPEIVKAKIKSIFNIK